MSPKYIIQRIERFEARAIPEFHTTTCEKRRRYLNDRIDTACYLKILAHLKKSESMQN